jgi:hypothetical protein
MLATGRGELRKALAEVVREAVARGWVDAGKAEGWLEKLERGRVSMEGWPKYEVGLSSSGSLEVRFASISPDSIKQAAQHLRDVGLEEGKHYTVKCRRVEKRAMCISVGRAWRTPHGSPNTVPANIRSRRRSL